MFVHTHQQHTSVAPGKQLARSIARLAALAAALAVLVATPLSGASAMSRGGNAQLYIYVNGSPVDVTNYVVTVDGETWVEDGTLDEEIQLDWIEGHIYDMSENLIGYISG